MTNKRKTELLKVAIIGMGKGGIALARMFLADPDIKLVGVSNRRQEVPGISWAREKGIFITSDYKTLLERSDVDIVFDATGNPEVESYLTGFKRSGLEIVKGTSAKMMLRIIDDKMAREQEIYNSLSELKYLYDVGLTLGSAEKSDQALKLIVRAAMDLLDMPSGSAALFDEEKGLMRTAASIDQEENIRTRSQTWEVRAGSLTGHVLSNSTPTIIEDIDSEKRFNTSQIKSQGVKSVIAVTLRSEGKIAGILFAQDCRPRRFTRHEMELISLLGTMAASAVQKLLMLEQAEEMAITDELTTLFNHRYFLRTFSSELKRAERFKEKVSICMVDVDHFKKFNDTHGHLKGNEFLGKLAELMKEHVRETDIVARY
ncbi:MAG: diguanylate cyclase, partial [Nitrospinota bacterium]